jgi:hypothetical protein
MSAVRPGVGATASCHERVSSDHGHPQEGWRAELRPDRDATVTEVMPKLGGPSIRPVKQPRTSRCTLVAPTRPGKDHREATGPGAAPMRSRVARSIAG